MVIHQVANDVPAYEVRDDNRNVKVAHHNRLFLVAPTKKMPCPWEEVILFLMRVLPGLP